MSDEEYEYSITSGILIVFYPDKHRKEDIQ